MNVGDKELIKSELLQVRITKSEKQNFSEECRKRKKTYSEFLREMIGKNNNRKSN